MRHHRTNQAERGSALVQLTLIVPILMSLFLGTWGIGYSCYVYAKLEEGVRAAARYASVISYDASDPASYTTAVKNVVVYGDPSGSTTTPLITGLSTSNVNVVLSPATGEPTAVTVSISGYTLPTSSLLKITLSNKPWVQLPYLGNYVPL